MPMSADRVAGLKRNALVLLLVLGKHLSWPRLFSLSVLTALSIMFYLALLANQNLLSRTNVLTADYAATAIGAYDAKSFSQIYGIPSWGLYHHPGAVVMYYRAAFSAFVNLMFPAIPFIYAYVVAELLLFSLCIALFVFSIASLLYSDTPSISIISGVVLSLFLTDPTKIISLWEPSVVTIVFLPFLGAAAAATRGSPGWMMTQVVLGGICVQLQAGLAVAVVLVCGISLGMCFKSLFRIARFRDVSLLFIAGIVGYLPIVLDLLVERGTNVRLFLNYAKFTADRPRLSTRDALSLVLGNAELSYLGFLVVRVLIVVLLASVVMAVLWSVPKRAGDKGDSESRAARTNIVVLILLSVVAALSAVLLYRVFATTTDSMPTHASRYVYTCVICIVAGMVALAAIQTGRCQRVYVAIVASLLPTAVLVVEWVSIGTAAFAMPIDPMILFDSPAMIQVAEEIGTLYRKDKDFLPQLGIGFVPWGQPSHWQPKEAELPWRIGVGLANLLRRSDVPYCIANWQRYPLSADQRRMHFGAMALYTSSRLCPSSIADSQAKVFCNESDLVIEFRTRQWRITDC